MEDTILSLSQIKKTYPGVVALQDVSLEFRKGEVHALVGENGAGKSTLIKVITGAVTPDSGTIRVNGRDYPGITPQQSRDEGIEAIYQEFNLVDSLSAAENICLGKRYGKLVNFKKMNQVAQEIFDRFHIAIDPKAAVETLSNAQKQIVEIAKAVSKDARVLIFDEPTAPLTVVEVDILMDIIAQLRAEGTTIIYISHRLDEIFRICDRVSVLRDGQYIATRDVAETSRQELIKLMVGRELNETYNNRTHELGEVALEVKNLTGNSVKNISFQVRKGEILGVGGLVGAGRTEIIRVLYGAEPVQWGEVYIDGQEVRIRSTWDAMAHGIGLVPEDRKNQGCFLEMPIRWNTSISSPEKFTQKGLVNRKREQGLAEDYRQRLRIRTPSVEQLVMNLSGGNQQKVVIAKALAADSNILILDEPTRGVDVGAKQEIYELMNQLCAEGKSIIMISSDMEELLGMSDRIVVLYEHQLAGEVTRDQLDQEYILHLASGGKPEEWPMAQPVCVQQEGREHE